MNETEAIAICVIVLLTLFGIWLLGILGFFLFLLMAFGLIVLLNLHKKYFKEEEIKTKYQSNWQCPDCLRINSAKAKYARGVEDKGRRKTQKPQALMLI